MEIPWRFEGSVVLLADEVEHHRDASDFDDSLEVPSRAYIASVQHYLHRLANNVLVFKEPALLAEKASELTNPLVLSIWSGRHLRTRRTLVPAICQALNIPFVGGDSYAHAICQDKSLSKALCARYGLGTPRGYLVETLDDIRWIETLTPPLILKPNFEGGSIGISARSLSGDIESAQSLAATLLVQFPDGILAEEFIAGPEVSLVIVGTRARLSHLVAVELHSPEIDLDNNIYSYEIKKKKPIDILHRDVTSKITVEDLAAAKRIFQALGKVDYMRIDGRLNGGRLIVTELSPDVHIGKDCTFSRALAYSGLSYEESLGLLLQVGLESSAG